MAETPVNLPDEPTEQSVKQALASMPSWEEWLAQHDFIKGEKHRSAISAVEWNRDWKKIGRGWRLRVAPAADTINIIVYNSTLTKVVRHLAMVSVAERSVVNIVSKLIGEIERNVADATKKRRIRAYTSQIPYEEREDEVVNINGPVMTPDQMDNLRRLGLMRPQQEAEEPKKNYRLRSPIPEDPTGLSPEDLEKVTRYVKVRCFQPGQRVRVRSERQTRLNGELGTVVDATAHACYVAIDSYVEANDPDPFRFEEDELEPIFNESELPQEDEPTTYLAAMDYTQMLPSMGYREHNDAWQRSTAYVKAIELGTGLLRLEIEALPNAINPSAVVVYIEYVSGKPDGRVERIQEIVFDGLDVVDAVRDIEQLAASSVSISDFGKKLEQKNYPGGSRIPTHHKLRQLFGESFVDEAIGAEPDPDDPERYLNDLQRHADVINAFREHGVKMRRRMSADRPYYEMFWIPTAVSDVTYDLKLEPSGEGWIITASGQKKFYTPQENEFYEPFDIEDQWYIQTANPDEIAVEVDEILYALGRYQGPDEPPNMEPDYDDLDEGLRERILCPAVYLAGHVYIGSSHVAIMTHLEKQGLLVQNAEAHQEPHHGWWTSAGRFLDTDQDVNELEQISPEFRRRTGDDPGLKGEELPLARKIGTEVRMVENIDDIADYYQYAVGSANWNPVMMLTSKDVRQMLRGLHLKVNSCYKSRITHGWVTTSEPATPEVFKLMREKSQAFADFVKDHIRDQLIKRFPNLSGQTPQGINMDVFDKKIHLSVWQWSGETSADPENPHNYVMYVDIQPADYMKRRRGGEMVRESEDPDEIGDITGYAKGTTDPVKVLEEFGYVYGDMYGYKRWNKYWDLPRPLQTKREWWTPTFSRIWGSPDTHGQFVYGLIDPDPMAQNAKRTGYIIVQPLNRTINKDDWDIVTSLRRMLLQVDNLMRQIPDTITDPDAMFNWLATEMERIKNAVNSEADKTWNEALEVPDPDDPEAMVKRTHQAKLGELVDMICPKCGHKRQLLKNWPDDFEGWGSKCEVCDTFIPYPQHVIEAEEPEPEIDAEKYAKETLQPEIAMKELGYVYDYTSAFPHWRKLMNDRTQFMVWFHEDFERSLQVYEAHDIHWKLIATSTMQKLGTLKSKLTEWEKKWQEGTLIDQKSGIVNEAEDDVDPMAYAVDTMLPDKMLTDHGYHPSSEGYWAKPIDPQTTFVVWPGYEGADYTFMVYRDVDGAWQSQGKYAFTAPVRELQQRLEQWEKNLSTVDFTRSGALHKLVGEGVDDPGEVLAAHKPFVYSLYGQYANYDAPVNFRVFPNLTEAVEEARKKNLHDEYDYVWVEEYEADDLSGWETGETFAVTDTGVRYEITSDYNVIKHVEEQPRGYARPPNQPRRVRENEEDEMDPKRYIETTFDPVEFLKASGWFKLKVEAYEYWAKDFPLPHEFVLGGMVFTKLRVVVGFDLKLRGAYSCHIIIYWVQEDGNGFPGKNWTLDPQLITPADELATNEEDFNMPLRRFVVEIGTVLSRIQWPPNEKATLLANTHLEADVSKFINALNYKAKQPLNDPLPDQVMGEAKIPNVDDPETFVRNYARGRFYVAGKTAEGETYFWHYGIPSWLWAKHEPDRESSKEYSDAISIARNLRGKHVRYPVYDGPLILDVFIVPEKGGDFIRVA